MQFPGFVFISCQYGISNTGIQNLQCVPEKKFTVRNYYNHHYPFFPSHLTGSHSPSLSLFSTTYPMMGDPPSASGAVQESLTKPRSTSSALGLPGASGGSE